MDQPISGETGSAAASKAPETVEVPPLRKSTRHFMLALGLLCTAVGIAGLILPLLPGTLFLLIAAWAFSRSSERLHQWLYHHPRFGRTIREWYLYRAIPPRAKVLAITMMSGSFAYVAVTYSHDWLITFLVGATLAPVAIWIATRPNGASARSTG